MSQSYPVQPIQLFLFGGSLAAAIYAVKVSIYIYENATLPKVVDVIEKTAKATKDIAKRSPEAVSSTLGDLARSLIDNFTKKTAN
jgi:hypothetical protein